MGLINKIIVGGTFVVFGFVEADLKVIEVFVERGTVTPELYMTNNKSNRGKVYIRLQNEIKGPLSDKEIADWQQAVSCRQQAVSCRQQAVSCRQQAVSCRQQAVSCRQQAVSYRQQAVSYRQQEVS